MALSKLNLLYKAVVTDHSKNPRHYGSLEGVDKITLNNPTCGDVISLSVKIEEEKIAEIAFAGSGCSISMASASMMTEAVLGKTTKEGLDLVEVFSQMVQGQEDPNQEALGDASLLASVSKFPQRIKCSTLAWHALKQAIERKKES